MNNQNYLKLGSYNVICDRCGIKRKRDLCQFEWTGLLTCIECWDPKHPWFEPLPIPIDSLPVPDARPRPIGLTVSVAAPSMGIIGSSYRLDNGSFASNVIISNWDAVIGGDYTQEQYDPTKFM